MKRNARWLVLLTLIIAIILTACADSHKALYGKWEALTSTDLEAQGLGSMVFEFQPEGNLRITISSITVDIGYSFVDNNTIRFTGDGQIASVLAGQEVDYKVSGDKLELISNNDTIEFEKIK